MPCCPASGRRFITSGLAQDWSRQSPQPATPPLPWQESRSSPYTESASRPEMMRHCGYRCLNRLPEHRFASSIGSTANSRRNSSTFHLRRSICSSRPGWLMGRRQFLSRMNRGSSPPAASKSAHSHRLSLPPTQTEPVSRPHFCFAFDLTSQQAMSQSAALTRHLNSMFH